jgi:KaiC/GvpD/RAD55 family RecA-like ATPase
VTDQDQAAPPPEARISTGTEALDVMLHGGFMSKRPYLIVGPAGTGKTTLALQFLCDGVRRGERCLIVTLEEPPNEMRMNHRSLLPDLDQVYVFDAIPDVMRYERAPFKDIAAVRQAVTFAQIPMQIRKTPELSSVEVTFTALEQTLKMEMARRNFQRMVIDSLTALQYFCMKGFDETLGAQTFLRFLSDLQVTTVLTVEAPLEDSESPERLLARGEIRLFRWEHDARTVRAIGVEKFRGSEHDGRLHPYRIAPRGLDINLALTISRDTQELLPSTNEPPRDRGAKAEPPEVFATSLESLEQDGRDLIAVGVDVAGIRSTVLEALAASERSTAAEVARIVARARGRVLEIVSRLGDTAPADSPTEDSPAMRRLRARLAAARMGIPPSGPPDLSTLRPMLERVLDALEPGSVEVAPPRPVAAEPDASASSSTVPVPGAPSGVVAPRPLEPTTTRLPAAIQPATSPVPRVPSGVVLPPTVAPREPEPMAGPTAPGPAAAAPPPSSTTDSATAPPTAGTADSPETPPGPPASPPIKTSNETPSVVTPGPRPISPPPRSPPVPPPGAPRAASTKAIPPPPGIRPPGPAPGGSPPAPTRTPSAGVRPAPPPLPSLGSAPAAEPPAAPPPVRVERPPSKAPASPRAPHEPTVWTATPAVDVPSVEAPPAGAPKPSVDELPPKRRRKAAPAAASPPRKRASRATKAIAIPVAITSVAGPPDPAKAEPPVSPPDATTAPEAAPLTIPVEPVAVKPKRRAPRRKAPPVTAAEPGSPPPEEARVTDASSSPAPPATAADPAKSSPAEDG